MPVTRPPLAGRSLAPRTTVARTAFALAAAAVAVLGSTPAVAGAQSAQRFSIQGSALAVSAFGDAYEGLDTGVGGELQVRYTPGVWSIGVGGQYSSHSVSEASLDGVDVSLSGVFVEPRRVFDVGSSSFAPYAAARIAFLKQALDLDVQGTTVSASASGTQLNLGGGVLVRASSRVNIDLGATLGMIHFGDATVTVPGQGSANIGATGSGQNLVLRAGLAVGF